MFEPGLRQEVLKTRWCFSLRAETSHHRLCLCCPFFLPKYESENKCPEEEHTAALVPNSSTSLEAAEETPLVRLQRRGGQTRVCEVVLKTARLRLMSGSFVRTSCLIIRAQRGFDKKKKKNKNKQNHMVAPTLFTLLKLQITAAPSLTDPAGLSWWWLFVQTH